MLLRLSGTYRAQGDTRLLAGVVEASGLARGARVPDVGTGGSALALTAARAGAAAVTAVDLSRCSVPDRICAEVPGLLADGGVLLLTRSVVADAGRTVALLRAAGLDVDVVARAQEPYGPVMRGRADLLAERGLVEAGQRSEELVVVAASGPLARPLAAPGPWTARSPRPEEQVPRAA